MKLPTKNNPPTKPPVPRNKDSEPKNKDSGFNLGQTLELVNTCIDTGKAYAGYKKEAEITKRAQIEGQKEIILGEQDLEKARMEHAARMVELDNADKGSLRSHEEAMSTLVCKGHELHNKQLMQNRVLAQLEAKEITAEEAALLLYGAQD